MLDEAKIVFRDSEELFILRGQLVATQRAFSFAFMKEGYYELRNFYCPSCGEVWGKRIDPEAQSPRFVYYASKCQPCGGKEDMLNPWEWEHLDYFSPNALAFLFLHHSKEENES